MATDEKLSLTCAALAWALLWLWFALYVFPSTQVRAYQRIWVLQALPAWIVLVGGLGGVAGVVSMVRGSASLSFLPAALNAIPFFVSGLLVLIALFSPI